MEKSFLRSNYKKIIFHLLENDYVPRLFGSSEREGSNVYIRHDVDLSLSDALEFAKIESDIGVQSNFFFQLNAETYNIWKKENLKILADISAKGHLIGLHVDELVFGHDEEKIKSTIDWFSHNIFPISHVFSFHRPSQRAIDTSFKNIVSCYSEDVFNYDSYCSDAARNTAFFEKLDLLIKSKVPLIQFLTHPGWWVESSDEDIYRTILNRRHGDVEEYLKFNFKKVFGGFDSG